MTKTPFHLLLAAALLIAGCAGRQPAAPPRDAPVTLSAEARAEMERKTEDQMKAKEKTFDAFTLKMDEYQDLLVACDALSDKEEDRGIKAACKERLKVLGQELIDLGAGLQEGP